MWKNLRTDLTEFVSTVAGDTTEALNRMDENFPDAEGDVVDTSNNDISKESDDKSGDDNEDEDDDLAAEIEECVRRMKLKETFTTPLLPEKKKPAAVDATKESSKEAGDEKDEKEGAGDGKDEKEEVVEDGGDDDGDDDDEEEDEDAKAEEEEVRAFLDSFSLDAKTDEISSFLEAYPDTLRVMFEELVPTEVTYEEFWQRYFYRCDPERVAAEWAADEERAAANRNQAVKLGLTAVSNFLGGAVHAVSASLTENDAGGSKDPNAPARRPPFVMSADSGDEDEEEVELGWDDDDDDDEEEGDEQNQMQIEFKDAAAEKLQEQLKTAIEERDLLHQTVEMQTKEITALKAAATAATSGDDDATTKDTTTKTSSSNDEELKKLKTDLFEKDAELAALRASILDTSGTVESSHHDALEQEIKRLSVQLNESETRAKEATSLLSKAKEEIEKASSQTQQVEGKLAQANDETQGLQSKLEQSEERANRLEKELQAVQEQLSSQQQQQQENAASAAVVEGEESVDSPATQGTVSSAVKVEAPAAAASNSDEGDGWDDDW